MPSPQRVFEQDGISTQDMMESRSVFSDIAVTVRPTSGGNIGEVKSVDFAEDGGPLRAF